MIAAEGEQKASRALREAAEVIAESSSALQVGQFIIYQNAFLFRIVTLHSMIFEFLLESFFHLNFRPLGLDSKPMFDFYLEAIYI